LKIDLILGRKAKLFLLLLLLAPGRIIRVAW